AAFTDANGVSRGADVVIAGHTVGQVTGVEVSGPRATVTMRVSPHYAPLHQHTTARIRYSTLLAQKYVEITPVSGGTEVASGGSIQSDNTLSPVDFDQFLSALDPQTRARLQTLIQQTGGGLAGQQQTINDLLAQLNGLSQESVAPLSTFHQHDPDLDRIVANLGIVSGRLAQSHQQLGDFVGSMSDVTGTLARNDQALASLIAHLGNVMGDFDATLNGNEKNFHTTIVTLDPLLNQLNGTLAIVYSDSQYAIGQINTNNRQLQPELVSAVSQPDGAGHHILRQFFVVYPACDQPNNPQCQTVCVLSCREAPREVTVPRRAPARPGGDRRGGRPGGPALHPVPAPLEPAHAPGAAGGRLRRAQSRRLGRAERNQGRIGRPGGLQERLCVDRGVDRPALRRPAARRYHGRRPAARTPRSEVCLPAGWVERPVGGRRPDPAFANDDL